MGKILDADPAGFSKTDTKDTEAIVKLQSLFVLKRIKPELSFWDKFPNIDGRLTVTTEEGMVIGELQAQIKTLATKNNKNPKYQCSKEFLAYCYKVYNPVLLIVVSQIDDCAYWLYMTKSLIKELDDIITGDSVKVEIPRDNIIKKKEHNYIKDWTRIIEETQRLHINSDYIALKYEELNTKYVLISNSSKLTVTEKNPDILKQIQIYLGHLNHIWDYEFNSIKNILYRNVWRFGLGYSHYTNNSCTTSTYPILYGKNILQILKFKDDDALYESALLNTTGYSQNNPIFENSKGYAYLNVINDVISFFETNTLITNNKLIARELIFSFINEFHYLMDLDLKNEYKIDDIVKAFEKTLIDNAFKILSRNKFLSKNGFFVIDSIKHYVLKDELDKSLQQTAQRIKGIKVVSESYNILLIIRLLGFLKSQGENEIKTLYTLRKRNWKENFYYLEPLSQAQSFERLKKCYSNFIEVYNENIEIFFPNIKEKLNYFEKFDLIIVVLNPKHENWYDIFYFETENTNNIPEIRVQMLSKNVKLIPKNGKDLTNGIKINNKIRRLKSIQGQYMSILENDTPLLDLVQQEIIEKLKSYLESKK